MTGGWNREQFYLWAADYLRWLWYHEGDAALPKLALFALKPLLEYDAEVSVYVVCIGVGNAIFVIIALDMVQQWCIFVAYILISCILLLLALLVGPERVAVQASRHI